MRLSCLVSTMICVLTLSKYVAVVDSLCALQEEANLVSRSQVRGFCIFFQDLADLEEYRAALKEVNTYISQVENVVSTKLETTSRFANPQEEYKTSKVGK